MAASVTGWLWEVSDLVALWEADERRAERAASLIRKQAEQEDRSMKTKIPMALVAILLLCLIGWTHFAKAQRSSSVNQTWEYRVDLVPAKTLSAADDPPQKAAIQSLLNQRGAEGWELVATGNYFYFKRPK